MAKLTPEQALATIRASMREGRMRLRPTRHADERMEERGITFEDIDHVLETGFMYGKVKPAEEPNLWQYRIEGTLPHSERRRIAIIFILDERKNMLYIIAITVMWVDLT